MVKFTLNKCKTKAAYSAKLVKRGKLNLDKVAEKYEVILETPILLVINSKAGEVIVHGYGELLFKKCENIDLMKEVAEEIYSIGLE
tara:strand:- start:74 stop:331 length:258 start_codon:yes stop_codon:yes gene_type:complete